MNITSLKKENLEQEYKDKIEMCKQNTLILFIVYSIVYFAGVIVLDCISDLTGHYSLFLYGISGAFIGVSTAYFLYRLIIYLLYRHKVKKLENLAIAVTQKELKDNIDSFIREYELLIQQVHDLTYENSLLKEELTKFKD